MVIEARITRVVITIEQPSKGKGVKGLARLSAANEQAETKAVPECSDGALKWKRSKAKLASLSIRMQPAVI